MEVDPRIRPETEDTLERRAEDCSAPPKTEVLLPTVRVPVYKAVAVAFVVVLFEAVKFVSVEEALEMKPLPNWRVVEVDCSPVPRVTNGYANELPLPQPVQFVTVRFPITAVLALRSVVEALPEA